MSIVTWLSQRRSISKTFQRPKRVTDTKLPRSAVQSPSEGCLSEKRRKSVVAFSRAIAWKLTFSMSG